MVLGKYSTCASVIEEVCGGQEPYLAQATTIVTGSNTGIGKKAAQELAYLGGRVVLAVRNVDKGNAAVKEIVRDAPKALRDAGLEQNVVCMKMDLSSLASVDDFAKEFQRRSNDEAWPPLKCLVLNAGIFSTGSCKDTENGIEQVGRTIPLDESLFVVDLQSLIGFWSEPPWTFLPYAVTLTVVESRCAFASSCSFIERASGKAGLRLR